MGAPVSFQSVMTLMLYKADILCSLRFPDKDALLQAKEKEKDTLRSELEAKVKKAAGEQEQVIQETNALVPGEKTYTYSH